MNQKLKKHPLRLGVRHARVYYHQFPSEGSAGRGERGVSPARPRSRPGVADRAPATA